MFASAYVAGLIYETASRLTAVTDVVQTRIDRRFHPQMEGGFQTPFLVYRMAIPALDDGPLGRPVDTQTITFEISFFDEGSTVSRILPAAEALHDALQGIDVTLDNGWQITGGRIEELPDIDIELGLPFVRVGGTYQFTVVGGE
jgi:hypothetical protein